mmetsp:Transcript_24653/g.38330  ORF Transcript_24653/g.38330 Transcript_24653/m.38330 type:complete len:137 (+) Transcript_24653:281-691(+)|eukprot:CAMPEP_0170496994 /NCGR_PEP_ID=MMETSP0208-20121228/23383_1 /TAXON_ID=197538 /ORGANISM="Strombidium inclinatum, Strain S3" /LENGTH=136 /DNA_ID=CAMNT_0010773671 /DNA_START=255 /DNA_END=665 /DNA_ORIENTATION=-
MKHRSRHSKKSAEQAASEMQNGAPLSLSDIAVSSDVIENMSMDEIMAIAQRLPTKTLPNGQTIKPMDRVVMFLNQEKKLMQQREEKKKQEAIKEIIEQQKAKGIIQEYARMKANISTTKLVKNESVKDPLGSEEML